MGKNRRAFSKFTAQTKGSGSAPVRVGSCDLPFLTVTHHEHV